MPVRKRYSGPEYVESVRSLLTSDEPAAPAAVAFAGEAATAARADHVHRLPQAYEVGAPDVEHAAAHGARGDGVTDDTAAIQAAIDAVVARGGGTVFIPPGLYKITAPLTLHNNAAGGFASNVRLVSNKPRGGGSHDVGIIMSGGTVGSPIPAILQVWSRMVEVRGISFGVAAGAVVTCAIDATSPPGDAEGSTEIMIRECVFAGWTGTLNYGVKIGDKSDPSAPAYPNNCDFYSVADCLFEQIAVAGIYLPNNTRQSMSHRFDRCKFGSMPIAIKTVSGSFRATNCSFAIITDSCIDLGSRGDDPIEIYGANVETASRFLTAIGQDQGGWIVSIFGGRFNAADDAIHPDGRYIRWDRGGVVNLIGCLFHAASIRPWKILAYSTSLARIAAVGCRFPTLTPFESVGEPYFQAWSTMGCYACIDEGPVQLIPDASS
jgi:hypothetical protein